MAFDKTKLLNVSGGNSPLARTFEYFSEETITTEGYFPSDCGIQAGDKVVAVNITKDGGQLVNGRTETAYYIKADAKGVLTAVAMAGVGG